MPPMAVVKSIVTFSGSGLSPCSSAWREGTIPPIALVISMLISSPSLASSTSGPGSLKAKGAGCTFSLSSEDVALCTQGLKAAVISSPAISIDASPSSSSSSNWKRVVPACSAACRRAASSRALDPVESFDATEAEVCSLSSPASRLIIVLPSSSSSSDAISISSLPGVELPL